jgi:hypothetical protein
MSDVHNAGSPVSGNTAQSAGPVRIFLSYASEDEDIRTAVAQSLDRLTQLSSANIRTSYDKKSLEVGAPVPLIRDITDKLLTSDYLVILYTGTWKKSFSWTGTELGIFWGFIAADERGGGKSKRQIIAVYFDEKPPVDWGALELNLNISSSDLRLSREQFRENVAKAISDEQQYAQLISTFQAIGAAADARLSPDRGQSSFTPGEWNQYLVKRSSGITDDIVPDLLADLHDSFTKRVKKTNVEQRLIEFQIPKSYQYSDSSPPLPDETVLVEHGKAFSLFNISAADGELTWGNLKATLHGEHETPEATWIIASIERSAISAISPDIPRDDEQIIRAPYDGSIFRLIITRQFEFYDGSRSVHMYFIPALRFAFLEDSNAAITLGLINIAVKYREIFVNPASELSVLDYYRQVEFDDLRSKVRRSIRQLLIIEDESHILKLEERRSIAIYYGPSPNEAVRVGKMQEAWMKVRRELFDAAQVLLSDKAKADEKSQHDARDVWVKALTNFVEVSSEINSTLLDKALDNLKRYIFADGSQPPKIEKKD